MQLKSIPYHSKNRAPPPPPPTQLFLAIDMAKTGGEGTFQIDTDYVQQVFLSKLNK